ncbi:MAG TPA: hypothetical protein VGE37_02280 [Archangium sp.]
MSVTPSAPPDASTSPAQRGLMSVADKAKLDALPSAPITTASVADSTDRRYLTDAQQAQLHAPVTVSSPAGWLTLAGQALTFALVAATTGVAGVVTATAQVIDGVKTFASTIIASAGVQVGSLFNTNGTSASDVGVKLGVSTTDGSVNASARLAQISTGIGGTETARYYWTKDTMYLGGGGLWSVTLESAGAHSWKTGSTTVAQLTSAGIMRSGYGFDLNPAFGAFLSFQVQSSGLVNQRGTDSTSTPGAATIDRPTGISAVLGGQSSVVITNSLVTASSHIEITPMENAGNNAEFRNFKVKAAAGSFTVTVSSSVTNAWPFSWRVATLLTS